MRLQRWILGTLVLAGGAASCIDGAVAPLPLDVTVTASTQTTTTADSISFVVNAQGGQLLGVEADYGDGATELVSTQGARTAKVTFRHAYSSAGTFQVTATVTDAVLGTKAASVQVLIQ